MSIVVGYNMLMEGPEGMCGGNDKSTKYAIIAVFVIRMGISLF